MKKQSDGLRHVKRFNYSLPEKQATNLRTQLSYGSGKRGREYNA